MVNKLIKDEHAVLELSIKARMVQAGIKQIDIAKRLKVQRSSVSMVISGTMKSARIRRSIARALNKHVNDLWPKAS